MIDLICEECKVFLLRRKFTLVAAHSLDRPQILSRRLLDYFGQIAATVGLTGQRVDSQVDLRLCNLFMGLLKLEKFVHDALNGLKIRLTCFLCKLKMAHLELAKSLIVIETAVSACKTKNVAFGTAF